MKINVEYTQFKDIIKSVNIILSDEKNISLSPQTVKVIKDGEEFEEKVVMLKYEDESISYEECTLIDRNIVNDIIKVLQELKYQIK